MTIKKVGVIGAGMMGAEIALCFAMAGYETILDDISQEVAENGKKKQAAVLDKQIKKGRLDSVQKEAILSRVTPTGDYTDMKECDLIIEAVVEILDVKQDIYKKLDAICKESTIIASNTSSISITKLASVLPEKRSSRFIGTHFNSPASVMKLVEVIPALQTNNDLVQKVKTLLVELGKEPVLVKDVVGFGLNRMFHAFCVEACRLVEEGVCSIEDVDKICQYGLGHPVGVFKLMDLLDLRLSLQVEQILFDAYGDRFRPSAQLQRRVNAGYFGTKANVGFHDYRDEK